MKVIVGLGNPGTKYAQSRHNLGFRCVDLLATKTGVKLTERRAKAVLGTGSVGGQQVVLAKPRTFMNRSGEAVRYLMDRFGATPADLVIVYDEIDLPLGQIRIRPAGSAAGHLGVTSIIETLHTHEFPRVRVGVGKAPTGMEEISFLLGAFSPEEKPVINQAASRVVEAMLFLLEEDIDSAMNRFN